jgi:RNA exonuclease NGL2
LEKLLPVLEGAGYSHHYAVGPMKKHGCLIAFNKNEYIKIAERLVEYDEQDVRQDGEERARRGSSFRTKNIALLMALRSSSDDSEGVIVATTHLFWHPKCVATFQFFCRMSHKLYG